MTNTTRRLLTLVLGLALCGSARAQTLEASPDRDVKEFARQQFFEGVPYEIASELGSAAVPALLEMLGNPREADHWANVVVILEMIGDPVALDPIVDFIESGSEAVLPRSHYVAKTSALMGLGYLHNRSGDPRVLAYLRACADPDGWQSARSVGKSALHADRRDFFLDLSKYCLLGLALSGDPGAGDDLRAFRKPAVTESGRRMRERFGSLIEEAIAANEFIRENGLAEYDSR